MEAIWGKKMSASEVYQILPYLELGKMCILGKRGKHVGVVQPRALKAIKNVAIAFARDSPTAQKFLGKSYQRYPCIAAIASRKKASSNDCMVTSYMWQNGFGTWSTWNRTLRPLVVARNPQSAVSPMYPPQGPNLNAAVSNVLLKP